jgi:predicted dehydrogenase
MKAAVIGVGHLGKHHARILASMPGVTLAGVVDINAIAPRRSRASTARRAFADPREIAGLDLAVIATPTESHAAIAAPLIEAGVHTLIEKPIAATLAEADRVDRGREEERASCSRSVTASASIPAVVAARRTSTIRASSKCIGWARSWAAASTSTSCST